jgi:hypothetical protein
MCSAWSPDIGIGVFSIAQGTVWRVALFSCRPLVRLRHVVPHGGREAVPQLGVLLAPKPVQVMPLSSITSNSRPRTR